MKKLFMSIAAISVLLCLCHAAVADEEIKIDLDGRDWEVVVSEDDGQSSIVEYVLKGETIDNWTEKVGIYNGIGAGGRPDVTAYAMAEGIDGKYQDKHLDIIREDPDDVIYELWYGKTPWELEQDEIGRIIASKEGKWTLSYVKKKTRISPEKRQEWIGILEAAIVVEASGKE